MEFFSASGREIAGLRGLLSNHTVQARSVLIVWIVEGATSQIARCCLSARRNRRDAKLLDSAAQNAGL